MKPIYIAAIVGGVVLLLTLVVSFVLWFTGVLGAESESAKVLKNEMPQVLEDLKTEFGGSEGAVLIEGFKTGKLEDKETKAFDAWVNNNLPKINDPKVITKIYKSFSLLKYYFSCKLIESTDKASQEKASKDVKFTSKLAEAAVSKALEVNKLSDIDLNSSKPEEIAAKVKSNDSATEFISCYFNQCKRLFEHSLKTVTAGFIKKECNDFIERANKILDLIK